MSIVGNIFEDMKYQLVRLVGLLFTPQSADPLSGAAGAPRVYYKSGDKSFHFIDGDGVDAPFTPNAPADVTAVTAGTGLTGGGSSGPVSLGIANDGVGGAQLSNASMRMLAFAGRNGAGACTATGAKVGDKVIGVIDLAAGSVSAAASFESTITVADQIQQSSASNLSALKYALLVVAKS